MKIRGHEYPTREEMEAEARKRTQAVGYNKTDYPAILCGIYSAHYDWLWGEAKRMQEALKEG